MCTCCLQSRDSSFQTVRWSDLCLEKTIVITSSTFNDIFYYCIQVEHVKFSLMLLYREILNSLIIIQMVKLPPAGLTVSARLLDLESANFCKKQNHISYLWQTYFLKVCHIVSYILTLPELFASSYIV